MSKMIFCLHLQQQAEALDYRPWPGELGQEILDNISKEAWGKWQQHQVLLINEYQVNTSDENAMAFLEKQMRSFLFHQGEGAIPQGFNPK